MQKSYAIALAAAVVCCSTFNVYAKCSNTPSRPDSGYAVVSADNDAEILDKTTNLAWQRCLLGKKWNKASGTCQGQAESIRWLVAADKAEKTPVSDRAPWRVPTALELLTLVDLACKEPAINVKWFGDTPNAFLWSSSTYAQLPDYAWGINFKSGEMSYETKIDNFQVRLVRSVR